MKQSVFIVLVLIVSLVAYAGAQKIYFAQTAACATADGGIHADANGFAVVNMTPKGTTEVTIQIQIRDAAPEHEYAVYSGGNLLGTFITSKKGSGHLHVNLESEDTLGAAVNIWNQVKPGATRLLRAFL